MLFLMIAHLNFFTHCFLHSNWEAPWIKWLLNLDKICNDHQVKFNLLADRKELLFKFKASLCV